MRRQKNPKTLQLELERHQRAARLAHLQEELHRPCLPIAHPIPRLTVEREPQPEALAGKASLLTRFLRNLQRTSL